MILLARISWPLVDDNNVELGSRVKPNDATSAKTNLTPDPRRCRWPLLSETYDFFLPVIPN